MKRIHIIISILCLSVGTQLGAQQEYSMHFMRDVWNSNYTNPGFMPQQTWFFGGVSTGASLSFKGLGDTPLFIEEEDGRFAPNYQEIIDNVDEEFRIRQNITADQFAFGFRVKRLFFSLNTATKVSTQVTLPRNFFEVGWYGNEAFIGEPVEFGPSVSFDAYQEFGLGVNYMFPKGIAVGARAKRLVGIIGAFTDRNQLTLETGESHYETNITTDYSVNISSPFIDIDAPENGRIFDIDTRFDSLALDNLLGFNLPSGNGGWAFDFGATYAPSPRFELALSVLDLGYLNYNSSVSGLESSGTFSFDGLGFDEAVNENSVSFTSVYDSLQNLLTVTNSSGNSFRKTLSPKLYLSALTRVGFFELGGMMYNEFTNDGLVASFGLSARYVQEGRLSFGAVYAYHDARFDNIGVNTSFRLGPLQFHFLVDNIFPLFQPDRFEYTNIRVGTNFIFGTKKMKKIRREYSNPPPVLPTNPEEN